MTCLACSSEQVGIVFAGGEAHEADLDPGRSSATLMVLVPMEPVEPRRTTFFTRERLD